MLAVQVQYQDLQERIRHNKASEGIEKERNEISWGNLTELRRHNVAGEQLGWANLNELTRHNEASEAIGRAQARASMLGAQAAMKQAETSDFLSGYQADLLKAQKKTELSKMQQHRAASMLAEEQAALTHKETGWYEMNKIAQLVGGFSSTAFNTAANAYFAN